MLTIIIRTVIVYIFLVLVVRLMGKRQIGELQISELAISLMLSELAVMPITDASIPLAHSAVPILILIFLEIILTFTATKSRVFKRIFDGTPNLIISHGKLDQKQLSQIRISLDELLGELRLKDVNGIRGVDYALLEQNGRLSVITGDNQVTGLDHALVVDGAINKNNLDFIGKNEAWLLGRLSRRNLELKKVFLYSLDDAGVETIIEKEI